MIKIKKLRLARETLVLLPTKELQEVQGGDDRRSGAPFVCEPSGIRMCPIQ